MICRCTDSPDQPHMKAAIKRDKFGSAICAACITPPESSKNPKRAVATPCPAPRPVSNWFRVPTKAVKNTMYAQTYSMAVADDVTAWVNAEMPAARREMVDGSFCGESGRI